MYKIPYPLLSSLVGLIYFKHIFSLGVGGGGRLRDGDLFNLAKTMVSVLHKEPKYKVEKFK